jgi:all-trans-8'-apo-beta-carotenal 15,15'-oxygenase
LNVAGGSGYDANMAVTFAEAPAASRARQVRAVLGRAFHSLAREHGFEDLAVEGTLPADLDGTLYRNGPAIFEAQGVPYRHWFDGDGAISAVRISGGKARGGVRVTVSKELAVERAAGRPLYTSGYTLAPAWWRRLGARAKNTSSINVLCHAGRVYALPEMDKPYEIDPETLATRGERDLGVLKAGIQAHFRTDPDTGDIWAFALALGMKNGIDVYRLPRRGAPEHAVRVPLPAARLMVHDYAMSASRLIFLVHPIGLRMLPALLGTAPPPDALTWEPERGSEVIVVAKAPPHEVQRFTTETFFHLHCVNAFDEAPGRLVVDLSRYPGFVLGEAFMLERLRDGSAFVQLESVALERCTIDLEARELEHEVQTDGVIDFGCTAPDRQGRRHRYVYALQTEPERDVIVKLDLEERTRTDVALGEHVFPGEVSFAPRPNAEREDDGYLVTLAYDGDRHRSGALVLDARDPAAGVIGSAWFDQHIPPPIHGCWVPRG